MKNQEKFFNPSQEFWEGEKTFQKISGFTMEESVRLRLRDNLDKRFN